MRLIGFLARSKYLPDRPLASGLLVTLAGPAEAPSAVAARKRARTDPGGRPPRFRIAAIFSSFRVDRPFSAIPTQAPRRRSATDSGASARFFAAETAVSTILGRQSALASRFGRPNLH
ncbi:hypothetical protein [Caulobacter sp. LjRoot300]|uniref:hypothetical protein n=1 Tax=Caulobacter sp. LjRoot300 TaxID=3342321 RepID=UPI003ECDC794